MKKSERVTRRERKKAENEKIIETEKRKVEHERET
jgi:hypothetical protein